MSDPSDEPARLSMLELCRLYHVDMDHARHVGQLSAGLFDLTRALHGLDGRYGQVAYVAGLVHNVAAAGGRAGHHKRGRDILLEHPLRDVSDADRALLAVTTALHRKRWKPEKLDTEPSLAALPPAVQSIALKLAALVRMADGLDYSHSQLTMLGGAAGVDGALEISVAGPFAELDAARAAEKADLWEALFQQPVSFLVRSNARQPTEAPAIRPTDTLDEAWRHVMHAQLAAMLAHQPLAALGSDPAAIHQMRVATRRMRAALGVFGPVINADALTAVRTGLKDTARLLGAVRDLDVLLAGLAAYTGDLPGPARAELTPLADAWAGRRRAAHTELARHLHSRRFRQFADDLRAVTRAAGQQAGGPPARVLEAAPAAIYTAYGLLRAHDARLGESPGVEALHRTRIAAKRFRYTLEFFAGMLGPEADAVVAAMTALQDHLGLLNDASMALALIDAAELPDSAALRAFRAERRAALDAQHASFRDVWQDALSYETRRNLGLAVSAL